MTTISAAENRTIQIADYQSHPRNYNNHPPGQIERIALSLKEFGQIRSVVAWRGYYLAGHGVVEAAKRLDWTEIRADVLPDDYPEHLALAYLAADNELGRLSDPDQAQLAQILEDSRQADEDLLLAIGYSDAEYAELLREVAKDAPNQAGTDTEPQTSRAEELREEWGVELGQLWQLGDHRLICGDCTDPDVVARVMGGERADCVFTDPPYNVASHSKNFAASVSDSMENLRNEDWDNDFDLLPSLSSILSVMGDDCSVYICTSHFLADIVWAWMETWATHHEWCVWHKPNPMPSLSKRHWTWDGELIPYATRGRHTFNFPPVGHAPSVWTIPKYKHTDHPTEKPAAVPEMAISHSSQPGDIVADFFLGSGTTLIACENLNRKCRAIELSPAYVAVILERWAEHTGERPILLEAE